MRILGLFFILSLACGPDSPEESGTGSGGSNSSSSSSSSSSDTGTGGADDPPTGGGEGGDTGSAPAECPADPADISSVEALAETIGAIACAKAEACGCPDVPDDCVAQEIDDALRFYEAHLVLGMTFDPGCAGLFAALNASQSCEYDTPNPCPACPVFVGALAEGEACEVGDFGLDACAGSLSCVMGQCTQLVEVGAGETCVAGPHQEVVALCAPDQFCRPATDVCTPYPALGEACVDGGCAPGAWCDGTQVPGGVCAAQRAVGEACEAHGQCASFRCIEGACAAHPAVCKLTAQ